jgi:glyoxylase-like metal-dependent hydrolase (beta-lactamase superfamily II)
VYYLVVRGENVKLIQVSNVYQITVLSQTFPVNCFIYEEQNELYLIDTGLPLSKKHIVNTIKVINKPLTKIILTHPHHDHVGSLDEIKKIYPKAQLYISKRDGRLLKGDKTLEEGEPKSKIKGSFHKIKSSPDILVEDGDSIGNLKVVETKGHTPGSISLYCEKNKMMFVGDLLHNVTDITLASTLKWRFPFLSLATWNRVCLISSVKKIIQYEIVYLFFGHGNYAKHPLSKLSKVIDL